MIVKTPGSQMDIDRQSMPPDPMNHVKYLRAGPAEMPFPNWYAANTNHNRIMSVYVLLRTVVPRLLRAKVDRHN